MAGNNQMVASKQAASASPAMDHMKQFWAGLRPQQRIYLGVGLAATLAVALFFVKLIATPTYKPLMTGMEPADAQAIATQLTAKKIPYLLSPDGTSISVPADQVDAARLEVASHDSPHSGRIGFEIFDKVSWGQTEFDEKVNYQRAMEGELERTIQTMSSVKSARVHLVMATDSVFIDRERGAKASVTLRLRRGSLSREDASAISRLVAGAVDELKPADVVIVDADSNQALGQNGSSSDPNDGVEQDLTRRLIATLAPVVGADRIHASVNVEYETDSSEESEEKYDPAVSATLTMQHSEESNNSGTAAGGVPGTSSNVPKPKVTTPPTAAAKEQVQSSKTDNNTYGVNRTTRHVIEPAGSIRRITAAVVVDDAIERKQVNGKWVQVHQKRQPEELQLISQIAQAAIGFNSARGDVMSVQNLSFDRADAEDLPPATVIDKVRKGLTDYSSVIRYAALLALFVLVYLLMIRPIQKRALATPIPLPAANRVPVETEPEISAPDAAAILAHRNGVLKKQLAESVKAEPVSSTTAVRAWLQEGTQ
jgi:flagellar M-ring protein FliF